MIVLSRSKNAASAHVGEYDLALDTRLEPAHLTLSSLWSPGVGTACSTLGPAFPAPLPGSVIRAIARSPGEGVSLLAFWSPKGGSGTSVFAAACALVLRAPAPARASSISAATSPRSSGSAPTPRPASPTGSPPGPGAPTDALDRLASRSPPVSRSMPRGADAPALAPRPRGRGRRGARGRAPRRPGPRSSTPAPRDTGGPGPARGLGRVDRRRPRVLPRVAPRGAPPARGSGVRARRAGGAGPGARRQGGHRRARASRSRPGCRCASAIARASTPARWPTACRRRSGAPADRRVRAVGLSEPRRGAAA